MNRLVKICMSAIMLVACGMLPAAEPAAFTKQIGESIRYSIVLPTGWQTSDMGAQVLAWPAADAKADEPVNLDKVPVKILVTAVDLTGSPLSELDLDKLFETSLAEVKKNVGALNLINSGKEMVNGYQAKWGLMNYTLPENAKAIQQLSYMFKEGSKAYVVECLVDKDAYGNHEGACKKIISSFKILKPETNPIAPPTELKQEPVAPATPPKELKQEPVVPVTPPTEPVKEVK